jgi:hypothetical protein
VWVPDAEHEALRDLVRAREAAKKDQLRARHRLGKFLLRRAQRPSASFKAWTKKHLEWVHAKVRFEQPALEATLADYLHEVEHAAERIVRLEKAIDEAVRQAPAEMRAVIEALQALRGVAQMTAATVVAESRLAVALPESETADELPRTDAQRALERQSHPARRDYQERQCASAPSARRGRLGYQHRPDVSGFLLRRQKALALSDEVKRIAWKAQLRLSGRYRKLCFWQEQERNGDRGRPPQHETRRSAMSLAEIGRRPARAHERENPRQLP